ncbi:hypothetical protein LA66_06755 [Aureimonas altamirensis]|uniref:Uncharacterized protein n=1 Tax=Aureimonas altamirensis TaxID=370622 RepID=A0A0B1QBE7_9HYPH|nr:hypothetical protein [Aureimonas altamirensis]KHJ56267.1 hypothetical protein LA66_06755 [Aureimonas altamirensis]
MTPEQKEAFRCEVLEEVERIEEQAEHVALGIACKRDVADAHGILLGQICKLRRALAASQPAPDADIHKRWDELVERSGGVVDPRQRDHYKRLLADAEACQGGETLEGSPRIECVPAADTGQAVAWQHRVRALPNGPWGEWREGPAPELRTSIYEVEARPLYAHPAPLDPERVREALIIARPVIAEIASRDGNPMGCVGRLAKIDAALRQKEGGR